MRVLLNVIWLLLSGIWLALGYLIAAIVMFVLILTIPFGVQALKLARYALWPFGRVLVPSASRYRAISVVGNIIWFVLAGWPAGPRSRSRTKRRSAGSASSTDMKPRGISRPCGRMKPVPECSPANR